MIDRNQLATRINLTLLVVGTLGLWMAIVALTKRTALEDIAFLPVCLLVWHLVMEWWVSRLVTWLCVRDDPAGRG